MEYMYRCLGPNVATAACVSLATTATHVSLAAAIIIAHTSPSSPLLLLPLAGPCWGVTVVVIIIVVVVSAATVAMRGDSVVT